MYEDHNPKEGRRQEVAMAVKIHRHTLTSLLQRWWGTSGVSQRPNQQAEKGDANIDAACALLLNH